MVISDASVSDSSLDHSMNPNTYLSDPHTQPFCDLSWDTAPGRPLRHVVSQAPTACSSSQVEGLHHGNGQIPPDSILFYFVSSSLWAMVNRLQNTAARAAHIS